MSAAHANGWRFGPRSWRDEVIPAAQPALIEPGESIANIGFELLAGDGVFVSWHACVLDACDALRFRGGPGKIVRCSDRALIKSRRRA